MKILVNFADEIKIIWYSIKKINIMENNEKNKYGKPDPGVFRILSEYY